MLCHSPARRLVVDDPIVTFRLFGLRMPVDRGEVPFRVNPVILSFLKCITGKALRRELISNVKVKDLTPIPPSEYHF